MAEAISIAGLTMAVFDQLLKLSDRTIQFMSDARSFDEVGNKLSVHMLVEIQT
jgi:hypothetical protein